MKILQIGDKVRINPKAWTVFVNHHGVRPGAKFNPGIQTITAVGVIQGVACYTLEFRPGVAWAAEDLIFVPEEKPLPVLDNLAFDNLTRAFCSVMEMWGRRYDTECDDIPDTNEGESFGCPVAVDLGQLAVAHSSLLTAMKHLNPKLYDDLFQGGAVPDAPLPKRDPVITNLDDVRIRAEREFEGEQIAYVEALWGKETYAFNAAIRDLEAMRRGKDDGTLRRPETYHEGMLLVHHVRALANDLARNFAMDHLVREDDDLGPKK